MHAQTRDLFDDVTLPKPTDYFDAFDTWVATREKFGALRERSSVSVYRSMWNALATWCVAHGLHVDDVSAHHLQAYLSSRASPEDLTARHAWRLLTLVDAVLAHRAKTHGLQPNSSARDLLMSTPAWRFANSSDKNPLPEHLHAAEARRLVQWLLDPASAPGCADASAHTWQSLRNRTAVALQLGAGLTPGDVRAAATDGVVSEGSRSAGLPWKLRLPQRGAIQAREAPVAPWAGRLLRTWLDTRCALQISGTVLFPAARDGRPWGKVSQYSCSMSVMTAAGVPDAEGGSFKLRHTFALRQLRRGTSPDQVARWMGLSDVASLAAYRRVLMAPEEVD